MDASLVLTKPAQPTPPPANASANDARDTPDDFAAHLPAEEPTQPRRTAVRETTAGEGDIDTDSKTHDAPADGALTLSAPAAPALVRPPNSVVTFDLSALIAAAQPAALPATPAPTPASAPKDALSTSIPALATPPMQQPAPAVAAPAQPPATMPTQPADTVPAQAAVATDAVSCALDAPVQSALTAPVSETRAPPRLRAGRSDAVETPGAETKVAASAPATASQTAAVMRTETAVAVQAPGANTPAQDKTAAIDPALMTDTAPAETHAQRLNEATGPQGHRATTPAALVAQHIIRRFEGRSTSIDVRLDPPELGRVQVSLEVGADSKVTATVTAEHPATLAELVRSARDLERALQDAGLELDAGGLSFDLAERGDNDNADARETARGSRHGEEPTSAATMQAQSRPFGLEAWRGARVDVMV